MKMKRIIRICLAVCLILGITALPAGRIKAHAAEVIATVSGTVMSGTTSEILLLSTKEGKMEIKMDSATDTSECKVLLPDSRIYVSVSHGSDGYLHAVKITANAQATAVTVDSSNCSTVTGTISSKTKGDVLYFNTPQGEMQIKLDTSTNMNGCKVLLVGQAYSIICARGSDAYMHAVSISDSITAPGGAPSGLTPMPAKIVTDSTTAVTGTVGSNTKEDLLYLSTNEGEMQIKIDANTDSRSGMVLVPNTRLTVYVYHGNDAYMHAATILSSKTAAAPVGMDTSSPATVTGTVADKSTENVLFLNTPQGEMELKLDAVRNVSNCKVLISGKRLSVTCTRGSDACMHALDITAV